MQVIDRIDAFRKELDAARGRGRTVGLVPTMGFLHDGHASLIGRSTTGTSKALASSSSTNRVIPGKTLGPTGCVTTLPPCTMKKLLALTIGIICPLTGSKITSFSRRTLPCRANPSFM